jgi:hypothetical protein
MAGAGRADGQAHGDVDQEDRAPLAAQDVGRHEHAAQDLAGHRADRQRDRVQPDRPDPLGPSKASWMPVSAWGNMSAAPAPCNTRAAISATGPGARPQSSEAPVKTPTPSRNTRR